VRPVRLEIDLGAIRANTRTVCELVGDATELIAVIKADAYGHGAVPAARAALRGGAHYLAVALVDEALELRAAGITAPIILLTSPPEEATRALARQQIEVVVSDATMVRALGEAASRVRRAVRIHLKIDTGMGRQGVRPGEVFDLLTALENQPGLKLVGVCSQLSCPLDRDVSAEQLRVFCEVTDRLPSGLLRHLASSAATAVLPETRLDAVRCGAFLYGLHLGVPEEVRPTLLTAMSLQAQVALVKRLPAGHPVGYGQTWRAPRDVVIALVPFGYADGYQPGLSNRGVAALRGRRVKVVGSVNMDSICLDVTDVPDVHPGDEVLLLGRDDGAIIAAEELAQLAGVAPHALPTQISGRLSREYKGG